MRIQDAAQHAWSAPTTEYWAPTGCGKAVVSLWPCISRHAAISSTLQGARVLWVKLAPPTLFE